MLNTDVIALLTIGHAKLVVASELALVAFFDSSLESVYFTLFLKATCKCEPTLSVC